MQGRLPALRALLTGNTPPLAAYIIPSADAHGSEYIAPAHGRREAISGFTGSAGTAVVTARAAALWTDGRYFEQAARELPRDWTLMRAGEPGTPEQHQWLKSQLRSGDSVGVDPSLFPSHTYASMQRELAAEGLNLVRVERNLVDAVWEDRPVLELAPVFPLGLQFAGQSVEDKLAAVQRKMAARGAASLVLTALDEVAWLFNLRGSDIEFNPVFFAFAVVRAQGASLYVEASRLTEEAASALQGVVTVHPYEEFLPALARDAGSGDGEGGGSYGAWIAPGCSEAVRQALGSLKVLREVTPVGHLKAVKNEAELRGMRDCHARDAVALAEFFMWLENQVGSGAAVDEVGAAERLLALRAEQEHFVSASFATIAGSGPNGSVIHYHATRAAGCRTLAANEMFLCDSGGQFFDGTTDVTRTVHFGTPTPRERECFTLVLQGHIGLSSAVFPDDTPGILLDSFARRPLWNRGLDYKHGTGHGVGSFLNVHEGPISISKRKPAADHGLRTGMVVSVEPGFYPEGEFGIRIENLVEVAPAVEAGFLTFRPLTLFPLQRSLIDAAMLAPHEVAWVDQYHARCLEVVGPLLAEQGRSEALAWFERNTQPLPRP